MSKSSGENGLQEQLLERNRDLLNQLQQKDSEISQFHELIHIMRQDLEVKEEQFDYLFASLKASRTHANQDAARREALCRNSMHRAAQQHVATQRDTTRHNESHRRRNRLE